MEPHCWYLVPLTIAQAHPGHRRGLWAHLAPEQYAEQWIHLNAITASAPLSNMNLFDLSQLPRLPQALKIAATSIDTPNISTIERDTGSVPRRSSRLQAKAASRPPPLPRRFPVLGPYVFCGRRPLPCHVRRPPQEPSLSYYIEYCRIFLLATLPVSLVAFLPLLPQLHSSGCLLLRVVGESACTSMSYSTKEEAELGSEPPPPPPPPPLQAQVLGRPLEAVEPRPSHQAAEQPQAGRFRVRLLTQNEAE